MCAAWMPLIVASSELTTARLTEFCFNLPFGLLLAVAIIEVFAGGRKSLDLDKGSVVLLVSTSLLFFGSAFLTFSQASAIEAQAATRAAGFSVGLGILSAIASLMKQQCYLQKLIALSRAKQRRGRPASGGSVWPTFYTLFLLTSIGGAVAMAVLRPDLDRPQEAIVEADAEPKADSVSTAETYVSETLPAPKPEPKPITPTAVAMNDTADEGEDDPTGRIDENPEKTTMKPEPPAIAAQTAETDPAPWGAKAETEPIPTPAPTAATIATNRKINPAAVRAFNSRIMPILESKCTNCHGSEKQKGGLRLDSPKWIRSGGDSGPVMIAFDPDKSYLYTSTILPANDPDVMPAKGKPLSKSQTNLIKNWIAAGAPMGDGKDQQAAALAKAAAARATNTAAAALNTSFGGMTSEVAQQLEDSHIQFKELEEGMFEIDCSLTRNYEYVTLDLGVLAPITNKVHTLDLSKTKVSDDDLAHVAKMTNLRCLLLSRTSVGDNAMQHIIPLAQLEILNLYGTNVSDVGLEALANLTNLKKLYLWNSKATSKGGDKLKTKNPELTVNVGQ